MMEIIAQNCSTLPALASPPPDLSAPAASEEAGPASPAPSVRRDGLKPGSPGAILMDTVCRPEGATHEELCSALGWKQCLPNMWRYAEKTGVAMTTKQEGRRTRYFGVAGGASKKKQPSKPAKKVSPKPSGEGIGATARRAILAGKSNAETLAVVKKAFPGCRSTLSGMGWYRNQMRKEGVLKVTRAAAAKRTPGTVRKRKA